MYLKYWGFRKSPFDNIPDPAFFYRSKAHVEGLSRLIYTARMRKGCALLTGGAGCGKTVLSQVFVDTISKARECDIAMISNPCMDTTEFLQDLLYKFHVPDPPNRKVDILRVLNERLTENLKQGKETFLLVDEAQLLSQTVLEEIRLLLNIHTSDRFLMTIFLFGQPEILTNLRRLGRLEHRVTVSYFLRPFTLKETAAYILYRQRMAGAPKNVFSKQAIEMIFRHSKGFPGTINKLCDLSLLAGFGEKQKTVHISLVKDAIQDGAI